jgi:tetratricopeptide (TPR) repeat protein
MPNPAATPSVPRAQLEREALRRNAAGVQLRRDGSYSEAATQHNAALEILRELDDQRSVALTLNNLALALSHEGDDTAAVALFEQAAAILGELGADQAEGQVIANLGLTHRRHGRGEEAANVLQLALAKLAPASNAYHQVEAELRRAS